MITSCNNHIIDTWLQDKLYDGDVMLFGEQRKLIFSADLERSDDLFSEIKLRASGDISLQVTGTNGMLNLGGSCLRIYGPDFSIGYLYDLPIEAPPPNHLLVSGVVGNERELTWKPFTPAGVNEWLQDKIDGGQQDDLDIEGNQQLLRFGYESPDINTSFSRLMFRATDQIWFDAGYEFVAEYTSRFRLAWGEVVDGEYLDFPFTDPAAGAPNAPSPGDILGIGANNEIVFITPGSVTEDTWLQTYLDDPGTSVVPLNGNQKTLEIGEDKGTEADKLLNFGVYTTNYVQLSAITSRPGVETRIDLDANKVQIFGGDGQGVRYILPDEDPSVGYQPGDIYGMVYTGSPQLTWQNVGGLWLEDYLDQPGRAYNLKSHNDVDLRLGATSGSPQAVDALNFFGVYTTSGWHLGFSGYTLRGYDDVVDGNGRRIALFGPDGTGDPILWTIPSTKPPVEGAYWGAGKTVDKEYHMRWVDPAENQKPGPELLDVTAGGANGIPGDGQFTLVGSGTPTNWSQVNQIRLAPVDPDKYFRDDTRGRNIIVLNDTGTAVGSFLITETRTAGTTDRYHEFDVVFVNGRGWENPTPGDTGWQIAING